MLSVIEKMTHLHRLWQEGNNATHLNGIFYLQERRGRVNIQISCNHCTWKNMVFHDCPTSFDSGEGYAPGSEEALSQGSQLRVYDLEDAATQLEMILP